MTEQQTPPQAKSGKKKTGLLVALVVLLVLIVLAVGGWFGWQFWQQNQQQQEQISQRIKALETSQAHADAAEKETMETLNHRLSGIEQQVLQHADKLNQLNASGKTFWMLNEAKSLASLASQRLLLTADLHATLALLKTSDEVLARVDDPAVLPARRGLAQDMEKVRSAQQLDITGLLLRIGALVDGLQQVTLPELTDKVDKRTTKDSAAPRPWWQRLLGNLPVSVQRYDEDLPLPLKPSQLAQVRLSLAMNFQASQLALLQGRADVYRQGLKQAKRTLKQYFLREDTRVNGLLTSIDELVAVDIDQALPKIGAGLDAIKVLLEGVTATPDSDKTSSSTNSAAVGDAA